MSIEMHHETIPEAIPGDNIGFSCKGLAKKDVRRGDVVGHATNPPTIAKDFTATVQVIRHPSAIAIGYQSGFTNQFTGAVALGFQSGF